METSVPEKVVLAKSGIFSVLIAAAGALLFLNAPRLLAWALPIAQRFDIEGEVSQPELLLRPVYSAAVVLLTYAPARYAFERLSGQSLEGWMLEGRRPTLPIMILSVTFVGLPILVFLYAYALVTPTFFDAYFREDAMLENLTPIIYFAAFGLSCVAALRIRRRKSIPFRLLLASAIGLLGLACLFLGLEEISYGQRIIGWETPAALATRNLQHETNLHNLFGHETLNFVVWLGTLGIYIGSLGSAVVRRFWSHSWNVFLPHQAMVYFAAALLILASHGAFQELLEISVALFTLLFCLQLRQATLEDSVIPGSRASSRV